MPATDTCSEVFILATVSLVMEASREEKLSPAAAAPCALGAGVGPSRDDRVEVTSGNAAIMTIP